MDGSEAEKGPASPPDSELEDDVLKHHGTEIPRLPRSSVREQASPVPHSRCSAWRQLLSLPHLLCRHPESPRTGGAASRQLQEVSAKPLLPTQKRCHLDAVTVEELKRIITAIYSTCNGAASLQASGNSRSGVGESSGCASQRRFLSARRRSSASGREDRRREPTVLPREGEGAGKGSGKAQPLTTPEECQPGSACTRKAQGTAVPAHPHNSCWMRTKSAFRVGLQVLAGPGGRVLLSRQLLS